jgi:hypothetical protein
VVLFNSFDFMKSYWVGASKQKGISVDYCDEGIVKPCIRRALQYSDLVVTPITGRYAESKGCFGMLQIHG